MAEAKRVNVIVEGKVQGVYYRASTREKALALGLTGWVRNLKDGRVEFEAQGLSPQLEELVRWARQGPNHASVSNIIRTDIPAHAGEQSFQITH